MTTPRYSTLLFDLDRTLFDFDQSERDSFAAMLDTLSIPQRPEIGASYETINRRLWSEVEAGLHTPSSVNVLRFEELIEACDIDADPAVMGELFKTGLGDHGELYPGAAALLDELAPQVKLGIVTNGITSIQRTKIARTGLDRWFTAIAISDELGVAKPDPAIFAPLFADLDVTDLAKTLVIGDSLHSDMAGGRNAGIATCWYNPGQLELTEPHLVDHTITSLDELPALICPPSSARLQL